MRTLINTFLINIVILSLLSPTFGQSKFSVSAVASPNFHYLNTKFTQILPDGSGAIKPFDVHVKQNGSGYSAGVAVNYRFSKQWSVATGILLNSVGYQEPTVSTNPNGVQFLTIASTERSFQVPLTINYRTSIKRLSPYLSAGALTSVHSVRIFEGSSKSSNMIEKLRPHPMLGVGLDYQLNHHISLIAQPTFVYFLPYEKAISYKNYQIGLQAQLLYKF